MGKTILLLLAGYFAILGLIQAILMLIRAFSTPREGQRGSVILWAGEDAEFCESRLLYTYEILREDRRLDEMTIAVLLPQTPEARKICCLFCRDHNLAKADLLQRGESIIMETENTKEGTTPLAAEDGTTEGHD